MNKSLQFKNPDVAAKYTSEFAGDPEVHQPGGTKGNGFKKKLSTVTLEEADRLYSRPNQNLLQLKEPGAAVQSNKPKPLSPAENKPAASS